MYSKKVLIVLAIIAVIVLFFFIWKSAKAPEAPENGMDQTATTTGTTATTPGGAASAGDGTPDPVKIAATAYTVGRIMEKGKYVTVIAYDGVSFTPQIVTVKRGETVRFVNKDDGAMRVFSNTFQNVPIYPGFGQVKSVGTNGIYEFNFTTPGVWGYHNLDAKTNVVGVVYVTN